MDGQTEQGRVMDKNCQNPVSTPFEQYLPSPRRISMETSRFKHEMAAVLVAEFKSAETEQFKFCILTFLVFLSKPVEIPSGN